MITTTAADKLQKMILKLHVIVPNIVVLVIAPVLRITPIISSVVRLARIATVARAAIFDVISNRHNGDDLQLRTTRPV